MSLRSSSRQPPGIYVNYKIGSSSEPNPSRRICHLREAPLSRVADKNAFGAQELSAFSQRDDDVQDLLFLCHITL